MRVKMAITTRAAERESVSQQSERARRRVEMSSNVGFAFVDGLVECSPAVAAAQGVREILRARAGPQNPFCFAANDVCLHLASNRWQAYEQREAVESLD